MTGEIGGVSPSTRDLAGLVDGGKDGAVLRVHVRFADLSAAELQKRLAGAL